MKHFSRWAVVSGMVLGLTLAGGSVAVAQPSLDGLAADTSGNVSTVARTQDGRPVTNAATAAEVAAYWTPARMAAAENLDLTVAAGAPQLQRRPAPTGPAGSLPAAAPTVVSSDAPGIAAETTDFSILQVTESATVGRVFFNRPDGSSSSCSASAVNSPKRRLVMTAGHCVHDRNRGGWFTNWQFIPRFRDGNRPFGTWTARQLTSRNAWINNRDSNQDMGIAIMNNNASGQTLGSVVGGNGLRWNWGYSNFVTILGYPADPPFNGQSQFFCQGTTWNGHGQQVRAWCNMTGGSSGGPWFQDYSNTTGLGFINSVVSHRHSNANQMDGPYFADNIKSLFDFAEGLT